jgi:hypothetical protein
MDIVPLLSGNVTQSIHFGFANKGVVTLLAAKLVHVHVKVLYSQHWCVCLMIAFYKDGYFLHRRD